MLYDAVESREAAWCKQVYFVTIPHLLLREVAEQGHNPSPLNFTDVQYQHDGSAAATARRRSPCEFRGIKRSDTGEPVVQVSSYKM